MVRRISVAVLVLSFAASCANDEGAAAHPSEVAALAQALECGPVEATWTSPDDPNGQCEAGWSYEVAPSCERPCGTRVCSAPPTCLSMDNPIHVKEPHSRTARIELKVNKFAPWESFWTPTDPQRQAACDAQALSIKEGLESEGRFGVTTPVLSVGAATKVGEHTAGGLKLRPLVVLRRLVHHRGRLQQARADHGSEVL